MGAWGRRTRAAVVAAAVALTTLGALPAQPAEAAGVTTHAWMADAAIGRLDAGALKTLLLRHREQVRTGAHFPDTGYVPGNAYGEEAHWQRYANALVDQIRGRGDCGALTDPNGPCAPAIAHLMGVAAHGMGDEVWDWLFEPYAPDLDEYYLPEDFGSFASPGGQELQMDLVAIAVHGRPTSSLQANASTADLLAAFAAVDFDDVDADALGRGIGAMSVVQAAEAFWAPRHIDALREAQPWMSNNVVTAPGGIDFAAVAIAGYWESLWGRLLGDQPPTEVSITYPADGQRRLPASGWVRSPIPGSNPGTGGARVRITAALTSSRPYLPLATSPGSIPTLLPAGSMTLVERDTDTVVPVRSGWPKSVPYGPGPGNHLMTIQPGAELQPCTWYRAEITDALLDATSRPVVPHSWEFRTGLDAAGNRCPDDPYTPDENFLRKLNADIYDRETPEQELQDTTYAIERGLTRRTLTKEALGSEELRTELVTAAFQRFLGRDPDPSGRAYWTAKLTSISMLDLDLRLASSPEAYRRGGGTNASYIAALYQWVFGRDVDPSGARYWTGRLDRGASRASVAKALLTSPELSRKTVTATFQRFLDRNPDPSGLTYWTGVLQRGTDPRQLWEAIISSAEYDRLAQRS